MTDGQNDGARTLSYPAARTLTALLLLACVTGVFGWTLGTQMSQPQTVSAQDYSNYQWSMTSVRGSEGFDYIVVVSNEENPLEEGRVSKQMAVYEVRTVDKGKAVLDLVGARTLAYDFRYPHIDPHRAGEYAFQPERMKKDLEESRKDK